MTVETQQISELFKDPRRVQRSLPFKRVVSHTYGKGSPAAQEQQPAPGPGDWDGTGLPPGPGDMTDPGWPRPKAPVSWGY